MAGAGDEQWETTATPIPSCLLQLKGHPQSDGLYLLPPMSPHLRRYPVQSREAL